METTHQITKHYCAVCHTYFSRKTFLNKHYKTQKHKDRINENTEFFACNCGKKYIYKNSLVIHQKACPHMVAEETVQNKLQNIEQLLHEEQLRNKLEKEELNRKLELLLKKCEHPPLPPSSAQITNNNTTNNNTTNTNSHNTTNNLNLQINAFGQENLDYITDGILHNCVNRVFESIPTLIEKIHFDPAHPENHTIKIPNKKLPHASVMSKDKEWKLMNKHDVIDNIMNNGYNMIDDKFNEDPSKFTEDRRKQYRRYQEKYDTEDKETMKRIKTDVEMVLINGTKSIHSQKKCV